MTWSISELRVRLSFRVSQVSVTIPGDLTTAFAGRSFPRNPFYGRFTRATPIPFLWTLTEAVYTGLEFTVLVLRFLLRCIFVRFGIFWPFSGFLAGI